MNRFTVYLITSILIILLISLSGCGVKGSPVPPVYVKPPAVMDLQHQVTGNQLNLTWSVPDIQPGGKQSSIAGAKVFRLKQPIESVPCQDCSRTFTLMRRMPARSGTMQFQDTLEKEFAYYYKIVLYDSGNHDGEDSNIVYVRMK